jgi:hypothetical protein
MTRNFEPVREVTMYQARCTSCGLVVEEYGDYAGFGDREAPIDFVVDDAEWVRNWDTDELFCPACAPKEVDE